MKLPKGHKYSAMMPMRLLSIQEITGMPLDEIEAIYSAYQSADGTYRMSWKCYYNADNLMTFLQWQADHGGEPEYNERKLGVGPGEEPIFLVLKNEKFYKTVEIPAVYKYGRMSSIALNVTDEVVELKNNEYYSIQVRYRTITEPFLTETPESGTEIDLIRYLRPMFRATTEDMETVSSWHNNVFIGSSKTKMTYTISDRDLKFGYFDIRVFGHPMEDVVNPVEYVDYLFEFPPNVDLVVPPIETENIYEDETIAFFEYADCLYVKTKNDALVCSYGSGLWSGHISVKEYCNIGPMQKFLNASKDGIITGKYQTKKDKYTPYGEVVNFTFGIIPEATVPEEKIIYEDDGVELKRIGDGAMVAYTYQLTVI